METAKEKEPTAAEAPPLESMPTPESISTDSYGDSKSKPENVTHKLLREWKRSYRSLEYYIEVPSIIIIFLLIAYVDLLLGSCLLHSSGSLMSVNTIDAIRNVVLSLQLFELLLQMCIFRDRFFSHWGYAFDTILLITRMLNNHSILATNRHHLHLLSFLRVWRFVRVVQAYVDIEVRKHLRTKKKLAMQIESTNEWKWKATLTEEDVQREKRLSKQSRDLVKGYQEEIDTLREALKIAAQDVAAVRLQTIESYEDANVKGISDDPRHTGNDAGIDVVEHEKMGEGDDIDDTKAWVTHPAAPERVVVEDSSIDGGIDVVEYEKLSDDDILMIPNRG